MAYSVDHNHPVVPVDSSTFAHSSSSDDKYNYEEFWRLENSFITTCLTVVTNECLSKIIENRKPWIDSVVKSFMKYGCVCVDDMLQVYDMSNISIYFKTNGFSTDTKQFQNQSSIIGYNFKKTYFNPKKLWFYTLYPLLTYLNRDKNEFEYNCPVYNSRKSLYELVQREKMNFNNCYLSGLATWGNPQPSLFLKTWKNS